MTERSKWADTLRVVCSFMVVLLHCSIYGIFAKPLSLTWWFSNVYDGVCHLAVPVFFILSGYFYSYPHKKTYKKIAKAIFIYLAWTVFYTAFEFVLERDTELLKALFNNLVHPYNHLWYLPAIIAVWFVAYFINFESDKALYLAIAGLIATTLYVYSGLINRDYWWLNILYKFAYSMSFFIIGYKLKRVDVTVKERRIVWAGFALAALTTVIGTGLLVKKDGSSTYPLYEYGALNVVIMAVCFFVIFINNNRSGKLTDFIQDSYKETLGIYLIHIALRDFSFKMLTKLNINTEYIINPIGIIVFALVIWLISKYIVKLCMRIPLIRELVKL